MEKHASYKELILLGNLTPESLDSILYESSKIHDMGIRIDFLSRHFLETPYQESTLRGDINTPEVFVINLEGIDCFTFFDYVESMRLSSSFREFKENLKKVRYRGEVSFKNRNHFFTDWSEFNSDLIDDVTEQIGGKKVIRVKKILNEKEDGTLFLQGIQPRERLIHYISANTLDDLIINTLITGDYIGIYSTEKGLDVSHVGIFIQERDKIYLRHASSLNEYRKVIDQGFKDYIADKPGIIIFRSRK
ncbi:MAG: N-acetylmuramoyl-L-alanine amidase-like domain-containing protein [Nitrospirota bacterium]